MSCRSALILFLLALYGQYATHPVSGASAKDHKSFFVEQKALSARFEQQKELLRQRILQQLPHLDQPLSAATRSLTEQVDREELARDASPAIKAALLQDIKLERQAEFGTGYQADVDSSVDGAREIIVFSRPAPSDAGIVPSMRQNCYYFPLGDSSLYDKRKRIESAQLHIIFRLPPEQQQILGNRSTNHLHFKIQALNRKHKWFFVKHTSRKVVLPFRQQTVDLNITSVLHHGSEKGVLFWLDIKDPHLQNLGHHTRGAFKLRLYLKLGSKSGRVRRSTGTGLQAEGLCAKHNLTLDFDIFGWGGWILAPKKLMMKVCKGKCPKHHLPGSPHALLRGVSDDSSACCSPHQLEGVSMVFFDRNGDVSNQIIPDLVVKRCGCS